jgi:hypothetical protein
MLSRKFLGVAGELCRDVSIGKFFGDLWNIACLFFVSYKAEL